MAQLATGAMYGGQFLPKDEFISAVTQTISVQQNEIVTHLLQIASSIKVSPLAAYQSWERFQTEIFGNPKTQLLAILNFFDKNNSQQWVLANEEYAIQPDGLINIEKIGTTIRQEYYSSILTEHLSQMFKTVTKKEISTTALNYLNKKYNFYPHLAQGTKATYANVFWTKHEQGFKMRGQVAEAFLTHVAKMHMSAMSSEKLTVDFSKHSILQKEGPTGFIDILYASKNKDAWFTGGDLIVTNQKGEVIANIQLKTSLGSGSAIGRIKTTALEKEINLLLQKINSPQLMAEHFYQMLETSAIMTQLNTKIEQSGYSLVNEFLTKL